MEGSHLLAGVPEHECEESESHRIRELKGGRSGAMVSHAHPLPHSKQGRPCQPWLDPCRVAESVAVVPGEEFINPIQAKIGRAVGLGPRQDGGVGESTAQGNG